VQQAVIPRLVAAFGTGACSEFAMAWSGGWAQLMQVQSLRVVFFFDVFDFSNLQLMSA
jgi:hypothetical protein